MRGEALKRMRRRMQLIFQDPYGSLNPRMPVSDIIGEGLLAQADRENGWQRRAVRDKRVGRLPRGGRSAARLLAALCRTSSRVASASASGSPGRLSLDPEFVVCDEPVSALDVSIQSQILNLLSDLRDRST